MKKKCHFVMISAKEKESNSSKILEHVIFEILFSYGISAR